MGVPYSTVLVDPRPRLVPHIVGNSLGLAVEDELDSHPPGGFIAVERVGVDQWGDDSG